MGTPVSRKRKTRYSPVAKDRASARKRALSDQAENKSSNRLRRVLLPWASSLAYQSVTGWEVVGCSTEVPATWPGRNALQHSRLGLSGCSSCVESQRQAQDVYLSESTLQGSCVREDSTVYLEEKKLANGEKDSKLQDTDLQKPTAISCHEDPGNGDILSTGTDMDSEDRKRCVESLSPEERFDCEGGPDCIFGVEALIALREGQPRQGWLDNEEQSCYAFQGISQKNSVTRSAAWTGDCPDISKSCKLHQVTHSSDRASLEDLLREIRELDKGRLLDSEGIAAEPRCAPARWEYSEVERRVSSGEYGMPELASSVRSACESLILRSYRTDRQAADLADRILDLVNCRLKDRPAPPCAAGAGTAPLVFRKCTGVASGADSGWLRSQLLQGGRLASAQPALADALRGGSAGLRR
eukprot:CAMPEP_0177604450 /NCGR_PEP_ID=MMETSP0419_2-20121207/16124_1 /TAXON_ID=582737 /ORGANISM="Tetraselmis sp., Strain GSL018" /LENGTH=412 /DNA_ID=CAMNT_0019098433 /DNA_START=96 /DNA_END=1330 /DNA_ORIENTATION=-